MVIKKKRLFQMMIPYLDLDYHNETQITFLSDIDCDEIYMDAFSGWTDKGFFTDKVKLLKL